MAESWTVTVDPDVCMGTGACAFAAPTVFELRDGIAHVVSTGSAEDADRAEQAAADCPVGALTFCPGTN